MAVTTGPAWLNISVNSVAKTKKFYESLGFKLNGRPKENELVSFLVGANEMVVHFFQQPAFEKFTKGKAADAKKVNEIIITIGSRSKQQIARLAKAVTEAGGSIITAPSESAGGYYGCTFADVDGHKWNLLLIE